MSDVSIAMTSTPIKSTSMMVAGSAGGGVPIAPAPATNKEPKIRIDSLNKIKMVIGLFFVVAVHIYSLKNKVCIY